MSTPHKARKMDEERRLANIIARNGEHALSIRNAFEDIKTWLFKDVAGERFDGMKADAIRMEDALSVIIKEATPFMEDKTK